VRTAREGEASSFRDRDEHAPDGFRYPSVATFAPPTLTLAANADIRQYWELAGANCEAI
jgi:hypothetical protein